MLPSITEAAPRAALSMSRRSAYFGAGMGRRALQPPTRATPALTNGDGPQWHTHLLCQVGMALA